MSEFLGAYDYEDEDDVELSDLLEWIHDQDSDRQTGEWDYEPEDDDLDF